MKPARIIEEDFRYYVNEPLGVVVAKIDFEDAARLIMDDVNAIVSQFPLFTTAWMKYIGSQSISKDQLIAKAKCNYEAGDVFDEEAGRRIAAARLVAKLRRWEMDIVEDFLWDNGGITHFKECLEDLADCLDGSVWYQGRRITTLCQQAAGETED